MEKSDFFSRILKFIANYPDLFLNYGIGIILVFILILFFLFSLVTFFSAYIANLEEKKFSTCVLITFLNTLFLLIFSLSFSIVPVFGTIVGFSIGIIITYWTIKIVFKASYRQALIVLVFYWFWKLFIFLSIVLYFFFKTFPIDIFKGLII